jgi:hypothetical protein
MKLEEIKNNPEIMNQLRWDLTPQTASVGNHGSYEITCQGDIDRLNELLKEKAGYYFYVNVWDCQARLALMYNNSGGGGRSDIIDFESPLLEKAVYQAGGMINLSGWYPLNKQLKTLLQKKLGIQTSEPEMRKLSRREAFGIGLM